MLRKVSFLIASVLVFSACNVYAEVIDSNWVGGSQGDWETASNWNPAIVPENGANTFYVAINGGSSDVEIHLSQNHTITQLDCYGQVKLSSNQWYKFNLTIINGLTNHSGKFNMYKVGINGQFTNIAGATFKAKGGSQINGASLYNQSGGTIMFTHEISSFDVWGGSIQNSGTILVTPGSETWTESGIQNSGMTQMIGGTLETDETFTNNSGATVKGYGTIQPEFLDNAGLIYSDGGPLALFSLSGIVNTGTLRNSPGTSLTAMALPLPDVNNQGTIEVNADGAVVFDCNNLNNKSTGIIKLLGGNLAAKTITQAADANFAGFGGITGNVVIEPNGLIKLTGPTNIVGSVTIQTGATLQISDGQTLITGQTTNNGTIRLIGGTVIFQGGYSGSGNITHEAGTYRSHFDINSDGIEDFKDFATFADNWLWQATWY